MGVDADFALKLEKDEQISEEKAALQKTPENAGVSSARVPGGVDGEEIALGCPDDRRGQSDDDGSQVERPGHRLENAEDEEAVAEAADDHRPFRPDEGDDRRREPIEDGENDVDDGER